MSASSCNLALESNTAIAGFFLGSGPAGRDAWAALFGLPGCGNAEVGERVGLGWTGPIERNERAKSGSEASRLMASSRDAEALGCGLTVGPGWCLGAGGGCGGALLVGCEADGDLLGYFRAAVPAARDALDADEPMFASQLLLDLLVAAQCCLRKSEDEVTASVLDAISRGRSVFRPRICDAMKTRRPASERAACTSQLLQLGDPADPAGNLR